MTCVDAQLLPVGDYNLTAFVPQSLPASLVSCLSYSLDVHIAPVSAQDDHGTQGTPRRREVI